MFFNVNLEGGSTTFWIKIDLFVFDQNSIGPSWWWPGLKPFVRRVFGSIPWLVFRPLHWPLFFMLQGQKKKLKVVPDNWTLPFFILK